MLMSIIIIIELVEIFKFISQTNRKLTRFLESVRYSDFISGFAADNRLGLVRTCGTAVIPTNAAVEKDDATANRIAASRTFVRRCSCYSWYGCSR